MKKYKGFLVFIVAILFVGFCGWMALQKTASYPSVGDAVSYPVNQLNGFELSIEKPTYSFLKGYTIRYSIDNDSEDVYYLDGNNKEYEYLERFIDGQWHRLINEIDSTGIDFIDIGGKWTGFQGSFVQKYDGYGTRLEKGEYRFVIELSDAQGENHYLAAKFEVK